MKLIHDTPDTLNKPLHILGVDTWTIYILIPFCYVMGRVLNRWTGEPLLGLVLFAVLFMGARFLYSIEIRFWSIHFQVIRFRKVFDPIRREHFEFTIEED